MADFANCFATREHLVIEQTSSSDSYIECPIANNTPPR